MNTQLCQHSYSKNSTQRHRFECCKTVVFGLTAHREHPLVCLVFYEYIYSNHINWCSADALSRIDKLLFVDLKRKLVSISPFHFQSIDRKNYTRAPNTRTHAHIQCNRNSSHSNWTTKRAFKVLENSTHAYCSMWRRCFRILLLFLCFYFDRTTHKWHTLDSGVDNFITDILCCVWRWVSGKIFPLLVVHTIQWAERQSADGAYVYARHDDDGVVSSCWQSKSSSGDAEYCFSRQKFKGFSFWYKWNTPECFSDDPNMIFDRENFRWKTRHVKL